MACASSLFPSYAVHQMMSLLFPVQSQPAELPATTEGRWRRRHLSQGHKAGPLTVFLNFPPPRTVAGWFFKVSFNAPRAGHADASVFVPRVVRAPPAGDQPENWRATNPRTGGHQPEPAGRRTF